MSKIDPLNEKFNILGGIMSISSLSGYDRQKALEMMVSEDLETFNTVQSGLYLSTDLMFARTTPQGVSSEDTFVSDYEICEIFCSRFDEHITAAELDVLKSIISGESLKDASLRDGKSYQTKRNQLSSLRIKTHLNQQALIQAMTILLLNVVHHRAQNMQASAGWLHDYLQKFYGTHARLHHLHLSSGRAILVADIGPVSGSPVLCMHTFSFPILPIPSQQYLLAKHGKRFLLPIRPNQYGAPSFADDRETNLRYFAQDCAELVKTFGFSQIPIFSHGSGYKSALAVATELGTNCSMVSMYSATIELPASEAHNDIFRASWSKLRLRYGQLLAPVLLTATKYFLNEKSRDRAILKQYEFSPLDYEVVKRFLQADWFRDALSFAVEHNFDGIVADCDNVETECKALIRACKAPIKFIFGEHDRHSCGAAMPEWLHENKLNHKVEVRFIDHQGQATLMEQFEILLQHIEH